MKTHKLSLTSSSFNPSQASSFSIDFELNISNKESKIKCPTITLIAPENSKKRTKKKKNPDFIKNLGEWNFPLSSNFREKLKKEKEEEELKKKMEHEKPKKYDFLKKIGQELSKISKPAAKSNKIIRYKALGVGSQELVLKNSKRMTKLKRNLLKYQEDQLKLLNYENKWEDLEIAENEEEKKVNAQNSEPELQNKNQSFILNSLKTPIKTRPHPQITHKSMKIRDWVDHMLCEEIDLCVMKLVNILNFTQMVKKLKEPKKFKKRIVAGFKETLRTLETSLTEKQSKCIILAINIQEDPYPEGIDQKIIQILSKAVERNVLIVHSCSRRKLGMAYSGKVGPKIGVVSIVNFQNYEESFTELKELVYKRRVDYLNYFNQREM